MMPPAENSLTPGKVAVIIPTYNAAQYWAALSAGIRGQSFVPERLIVIDSSSSDGTADLARQDGFEVISISPKIFNHGGTRQMGAELAEDADLLLYMTQDAVPHRNDAFATLLSAFGEPE